MGEKRKEINFGDSEGYQIFQLRKKMYPEIWKFMLISFPFCFTAYGLKIGIRN